MTVPPPDYRDPRPTEQRNPCTQRIDVDSSLEIVDLINAEDAGVAPAVHAVRQDVARAIDLVVAALRRGGRLVYVGAGTSGRLGVLDASECPPTFGTPPEMVVGVIAGGYAALVKSSEGAEDNVNAGMEAMDQARVAAHDFVLGIAASGTTPFVRAALARAQEHTSELQSQFHLVCRLLLEKKNPPLHLFLAVVRYCSDRYNQ